MSKLLVSESNEGANEDNALHVYEDPSGIDADYQDGPFLINGTSLVYPVYVKIEEGKFYVDKEGNRFEALAVNGLNPGPGEWGANWDNHVRWDSNTSWS